MNNKTLGALALLGAPSMGLGIWVEQQDKSLADSWFTGVWGLIYITAWMCSMVALQRMKVAGNSRFGRVFPLVILGFLTIANLSNVWQLVAPTNKSTLFWRLDMFWPLSNVLMLIYGLTVIIANRLTGWQRFVPLLCGLWFPVAMATKLLPPNDFTFPFVVLHTIIAWSLLAVVVLKGREGKPVVPNAVLI
ncbi:hypothetical protein HNV11_14690 [Spirosoma taeanense]|uniref:Uncharacterized protein n=1 Tax=Spirosoma taeanense TaxID=2735870 RepID=A0A6M5YAY9_9BACT|nr:hypothetical protein [Spirosoma taeanense]QJW90536.1 hypothetical protein HNV11_14690 [Spirosoma taeanense]